MAFTEYVPGMKPGSTIRNIIVGLIYLIFFYLIPFVLAYVVFTNRNGAANKLSGIPGISEGGGVVSALAIFLISIVALSVITAVIPAEETPSTDEASSAGGESPETDSGADDNSNADSETEEQSESSTESDASGDEQEEQVDDAETTDTEGDGAGAAETEVEEQELSDDELIPYFVTLVEGEGMSVEMAEMQGDTFTVEYMSFSQSEQDIAGEMGYVAGAYAGMVGEGHTSDRMEATILTVAGEPAGTFHVEYEWAEAYANGEISNNEFSQRVISTLESVDGGQARIQIGVDTAPIQSA